MNRISLRLVVSHIVVAIVGGLTTFWVVRVLAPALFDASLHLNPNPGSGRGGGGLGANQALRDQFAAAVDESLLIGSLVGAVVAAGLGTFLAYRIVRPLRAMQQATRRMAQGRYDLPIPVPHEFELAELATDVNSLGTELAQAETRRVRLLGEVAHEIRTPLTVIDGYVEGMIDGVLPSTTAELTQISEEVRRLRRLSEDLSSLSQAEEGRLAIQPRDAELGQIVRDAAERLRPQAADAGLELVVDTGTAPLPVRVDPDRIAQVVTNLVGNAFRATPSGGQVRVTARSGVGVAMVTVADTGVGLAATDLERIFERFYRVPAARTGTESGSGIGLTIARGIVEAHGGTLTAASLGAGTGATFTACLPLR